MTANELRKQDEGLKAVRLVRWSVLAFIWCSFAAMMFPIAVYTLPDLESAWYPPIREQHITDVHLKPDAPEYLLWRWTFIKQRKATPEYITFMAYDPRYPRVRYNVDTYIGWECRDNMRSDRTSLPSENPVVRDMCVRLPKPLVGNADTKVDGVFDFNVGHSLYTVPVKVPAFSESRNIPVPLADPK